MSTPANTETKKQHFLPFVYLKYFRCDPAVTDRKHATILRDDGNTIVEVLTAKQCYKRWYYRRTNTQESEAGFGKYEADWNEVVKRARSGTNEDALCFIQMVMYHFRNLSIRYQISTVDRYETVQAAVINFIEQKIMRLPAGVRFTDNPKHVTEFPWEVRIITMENPMLITSDNPSVMSVPLSKDGYAPFFLPISPTELMVAIDRKKYRFISSRGIDHDGFIANFFVAAQGMRFIYLHKSMSAAHRADMWEALKTKRMPELSRGSFEEKKFRPGHPVYGTNPTQVFRFLEQIS